MSETLIDLLGRTVHENWMADLRKAGVQSRLSPWGEEIMVPWDELDERCKESNRQMVRDVLSAISRLV